MSCHHVIRCHLVSCQAISCHVHILEIVGELVRALIACHRIEELLASQETSQYITYHGEGQEHMNGQKHDTDEIHPTDASQLDVSIVDGEFAWETSQHHDDMSRDDGDISIINPKHHVNGYARVLVEPLEE